MKYYINGKFMDDKDSFVHVSDLGLLRGYGIFDFFRCIGNSPMFLEEHLDRFFESARNMALDPRLSRKELIGIIEHLLRVNQLECSGIKIILTAGISSDGYTRDGESTLLLTHQKLPRFDGRLPEKGVKICLYEYERMLSEIKTTNYIIGVLKQPWLEEKEANDLLFHREGWISELPRSNFFIVDKNGSLVTPDQKMLLGITRQKVLDEASTFMNVEERPLHVNELSEAREAFLSGSGKRIIPVGQVDDRWINHGNTGKVTRRLATYFHELEVALEAD